MNFFCDMVKGIVFVLCGCAFMALVLFILDVTEVYGESAQIGSFIVLLALGAGFVNAMANRSINGIRTAAGLPVSEPSNFSKALWVGAQCALATLLLTAVAVWLGWLWVTVYPLAEQMGEYVENAAQFSLVVLSAGTIMTCIVTINKLYFPDTKDET